MNEPAETPEDGTRKEEKKAGATLTRAWLLLAGAALVALIAVGVVVFSGAGRSPESAQPSLAAEREQQNSPAEARIASPSLGSEDAPVTMIEYSDFQCPYCGKFAREVEPKLVEKYVEERTLRIEWRDFPYMGQESVNAAFAARAAQEQGRFWEYHDILYENQTSPGSGAFSEENLISFAREAGLDVKKFEHDMKSGKYEEAVRRDFESGQERGVSGTPTFFINGEQLVGLQSQETFEKAIEQAKREAEGG